MHHFFYKLLLSFALVFSFLPNLEGFEEKDNYREQCRSRVSGEYLLLFNDIDAMGQKYQASRDKLKILDRLKVKRQQTLVDLESREQPQVFDRSLEENIMVARQALENLNFEIDYLSSRVGEYLEAKHNAQKRLEQLEPKILSVFNRKYPEDLKNRAGYRFRLEFQQSCQSYHYLCPLTPAMRTKLKDLSQAMGGIEACERYASIRLPDEAR